MTHALLIGNPNCGKTTVFNALTGDNQRVGNWPGVTVEKKTGLFLYDKQTITITDLPGVYSLTANIQGLSQDEKITVQSIVEMESDVIINVVDACHLERHLYLTSQLLELNKPVILALTMLDTAKQRGITIDIQALHQELGCVIIPLQAHKNIGVSDLQHTLTKLPNGVSSWTLSLPAPVQEVLNKIEHRLIQQGYNKSMAYYYAHRIAEADLTNESITVDPLSSDPALEVDVVLADARYQKIHHITSKVQKKHSDASEYFTAKLDKIVLHRFLALPLFFLIMYLMFLFAINIGGAFQDFFDITSDTVFVQGSAWILQQWHSPEWLIALVANGAGKGINTTVTFIPVIAAMFFFLSLLEGSGYMARAAFVVDKIMRIMGLPGKAFVPMIVGFGCNVPAIMAARTLDSEQDRLLTVMMSPFMSCSARLAIYAVFVAAFFPTQGSCIVFSLYIIGILMAVLTGFILRKTTFKGQTSPLILELPAYHIPAFKRLLKETLLRLKFFIFRAGRLIIPVCIILGGLNALTLNGGINSGEANPHSLLSLLGMWITPLFSPMGIHQDNWPATVGLLTGMLAKEVVVGTLNSLYAQMSHLESTINTHFDFFSNIYTALATIPHNLSQLGSALANPIAANAADSSAVSQSMYGIMFKQFDGQVGAYAYLLFILLYIPCVSTMAVIRQEANKYLMWTSIIWSFFVAYGAAVIFYQAARFNAHPQQSIAWIISMILGLFFIISLFRYNGYNQRKTNVITNS